MLNAMDFNRSLCFATLAELGGEPPRTVAALSTVREGLQRGMALLALGASGLSELLAKPMTDT